MRYFAPQELLKKSWQTLVSLRLRTSRASLDSSKAKRPLSDVLACYSSWQVNLHPALEAARSHLNEWYTSFVAIFRSETSDLTAGQNEIRSRSNRQVRKERGLCSPRHDLVSSLFDGQGRCVGGTRCMGTVPRHLIDFERIIDEANSSYLTTVLPPPIDIY